MESRANGRTGAAIHRLIALRPKVAQVLRNGQFVELDIEDVRIGDQILVKPGAQIPTDGDVIEGQSLIDESMVSGEPVPVAKSVGEHEQHKHLLLHFHEQWLDI